MSRCEAVAPQGDLIVAVGTDSAQKLAEISSTIIKLASPTFQAMLGPSFVEGQTIYDKSNPLKLPDDDSVAMLNLFQILHYNANKVDTHEKDWLQKLCIVCDKYQCIKNLKAYIYIHLKHPKDTVSDVDRMIVAGLIGDKDSFESASGKVIRMPKDVAERTGHKGLLQLTPESMFSEVADQVASERR